MSGITCEVTYYPRWSSQGIRGVKCWRSARFTVVNPPSWSGEYLCGIHARVLRNYDAGEDTQIIEGIYIRA
jgi:hypothetical protein